MPGKHFLQLPGPSNVPDRILRAMDYPTIDHRGPDAITTKWFKNHNSGLGHARLSIICLLYTSPSPRD